MALAWVLPGLVAVACTSVPAMRDTASSPREAPVRPIVLVPGFGYDLAPIIFERKVYEYYLQWLAEAGFPKEHVYVVDYSYRADLDTIRDELSRQLASILDRYPRGAELDVIGHSMGSFAGLFAIMQGGFSGRVRKFVSIAGITQGWNGDVCARLGICGKAQQSLVPYRSAFVTDFLSRFETQIARLEKCSIYSPDDGMVIPYDAGKLEGGTNVELAGVSHLDMVWKKQAFEALREKCYGGRFR